MKKYIVYYANEWTARLLTIDRLFMIDYFVEDKKESFFCDFLDRNGYLILGAEELKHEKSGKVTIIVSDNGRYDEARKELVKMGFVENYDFFNGWKLNKLFYLDEQQHRSWIDFEKDNVIDYDDIKWEWRAKKMVSLIPDNVNSIMDIGCGNAHMKKYLDPHVKYYGVDYIMRDENTIVCDVNKEFLPQIDVDVYYMAGVLYYVNDIEGFFSQMRRGKYLIFDFYDEANYLRLDAQYAHIKTPVLNSREQYLTFAHILKALYTSGYVIDEVKYDFERSYIYFFRARRVLENE